MVILPQDARLLLAVSSGAELPVSHIVVTSTDSSLDGKRL